MKRAGENPGALRSRIKSPRTFSRYRNFLHPRFLKTAPALRQSLRPPRMAMMLPLV